MIKVSQVSVKQDLVIHLIKVTTKKQLKTLRENTESYIVEKNLVLLIEKIVFVSNQRPHKGNMKQGNYFNKTQNLCVLNRFLKG